MKSFELKLKDALKNVQKVFPIENYIGVAEGVAIRAILIELKNIF